MRGCGHEASVSGPTLLEVPPGPGTPIGKRLTLVEADGQRAVFFGTTALYLFDADDKAAESACVVMLSRADLASDIEIAAAFGRHRNTVGRLAGRLAAEGMAAVVPAKRGPKGTAQGDAGGAGDHRGRKRPARPDPLGSVDLRAHRGGAFGLARPPPRRRLPPGPARAWRP